MGLFDAIDYSRLFENLDIVAWDNYPMLGDMTTVSEPPTSSTPYTIYIYIDIDRYPTPKSILLSSSR